ncbi:MAG: 6-phosphogluconolactonase [Actinomycetota bacterium]
MRTGTSPRDAAAPRVEIVPAAELHRRAAEVMAGAMREALALRDRCSIALSGGRSPAETFRHLATEDLLWSSVDVFQVDERVAPEGDPDRNLVLIQGELRVGARVYPMSVTDEDIDEAARRYEDELVRVCGRPPAVDLVHLGLGADGHIASLVAGDHVLAVDDRYVAVTDEYRGYRRMTLTFPVLEAARRLVLVVEGEEKADALAKMLAGEASVPAARLIGRAILVLADPAAAGSA